MAVWHLGEGRHKEKLRRAVAFPRKGELDSRCSGLTLSPNPIHLPLKDTREISAGPGPASGSRVGSIPPGTGSRGGRC